VEAVKFHRAIMAACNAIIKVLQSRDFRQPCSIMYQPCPDCRRGHQGRLLLPVGSLSACRTTQTVDLRTPDRHPDAAVTSLVPTLSCRSCRPNAPFAELVKLSTASVSDEYYAEHSGNRWVSE
jgi:hypothetical protein